MTFNDLCELAPQECPVCHTPKTGLQLGYEATRVKNYSVDLDVNYYTREYPVDGKDSDVVEFVITMKCPRCNRLAQILNVYGKDELIKAIQLAYAMFINRIEKINGDCIPSETTLPNLQLVRFFNGAVKC